MTGAFPLCAPVSAQANPGPCFSPEDLRPARQMGKTTCLIMVLHSGTIQAMKRKHQKTLELLFSRPVSGNVSWHDIEALFVELGAEISEREGSRVGVRLFNERRVFHRPHPSPATDKGAVAAIREWLRENGVKP